MNPLPFDIPESLKSYLTSFQESPEKGISLLEQYVSKRRIDAVAIFLLATMYRAHGLHDKARDAASRSRALAPGSRLLEHLHYFLSHPDGFHAWIPDASLKHRAGRQSDTATNLSYDLENLIGRLTRAGSKRIKIAEATGDTDFITHSIEVDALATPTLALIYEKQGKIAEAIGTYERLCVLRPTSTTAFTLEIERLKQL